MRIQGIATGPHEGMLIRQASKDFARLADDATLSRDDREWCAQLATRIKGRVPRKRRGKGRAA